MSKLIKPSINPKAQEQTPIPIIEPKKEIQFIEVSLQTTEPLIQEKPEDKQ